MLFFYCVAPVNDVSARLFSCFGGSSLRQLCVWRRQSLAVIMKFILASPQQQTRWGQAQVRGEMKLAIINIPTSSETDDVLFCEWSVRAFDVIVQFRDGTQGKRENGSLLTFHTATFHRIGLFFVFLFHFALFFFSLFRLLSLLSRIRDGVFDFSYLYREAERELTFRKLISDSLLITLIAVL